MMKVNIREILASLVLVVCLGFGVTARRIDSDVGQGAVLNSDHYPLFQGTFESFYGDGDLTAAASSRILDWSTRKISKSNKDVWSGQTKNEHSVDERRNPRSRSSREVALQKKQQRHKDVLRENPDAASSEIRSVEVIDKSLTTSEPSSVINFPGGSRSTKYKRKPIMTYYEKLRTRTTASDDSITENTSEAGIPQITVRNHEERSQKVKKKNRYRQKTMKLSTTPSTPTTWEYHTPQPRETETPSFTDDASYYNVDSKTLPSNEEQIESTRILTTTTTTKKPRSRPTRRPSSSRKNSTVRTKPPNRGHIKFGDIIAKESGKSSSRISYVKESEESDTKANTSQVQSRSPQDIPRIQRQDIQPPVEDETKQKENTGTTSHPPRRKQRKNRKTSKIEIREDLPKKTGSESYVSTETQPVSTTASPNVVYTDQQAKHETSNTPNKNLRKSHPPQEGNSQLYPLGNPYFPQGFPGFGPNPNQGSQSRDNNGFFHPVPYHGNPPPQYGYYFSPPTFDTQFMPDFAVPGFHHSPHVLSLRQSILESQRDPSTTSEPYSFTIPNFRIPTIDYNHKDCKTLLREVKEVPVNQQNPSSVNEYQRDPRNLYNAARFKRGVKSIIMTKECFFPEGVPEDAIQGRNAQTVESSTPTIAEAPGVEDWQRKLPQKKAINEGVPRPEKVSNDKLLRRTQQKRGPEEILEFSPSEYRLKIPQFDPLRGYTFN